MLLCLGYCLIPCTGGLSLLCPSFCINEAEQEAKRILESYTLNSEYYDRNIRFELVKKCLSSHIEISFPKALLLDNIDTIVLPSELNEKNI